MEKIYTGKTKNVYKNEAGNYVLEFKDDVTGENGVFDPGANTVGLAIDGIGNKGIRLTEFFYSKLNDLGFKTHFINADVDNNRLEVVPASVFGKGLEVICRLKATGSFMRRYGGYASEAQDLDYFVEITLKDDDRQDPPISKEALSTLGILTADEYDSLVKQTKEIAKIVENILKEKEIVLYDIKLEFGRNIKNNELILIDEISGGNMRAYFGDEILHPMDLADHLLK